MNVLSLLLFLLIAPMPAPAVGEDQIEVAQKATVLSKIGPFIEWPPGTFASPASPLELCILYDSAIAAQAEHAARNEPVGGRPLEVRRLTSPSEARDCQILYVPPEGETGTEAILDAVAGAPVLTVTDGMRNDRAKGIVNFVGRDNRIGFEIDDAAAARKGLAISSKLLSLAVSVKPRA